MTMPRSKKELEVMLSRVKNFVKAKVSHEQYSTPSGIAAEVIWKAYFNRHIEGKVIADLGCGTGILGIGALMMGAKKVIFVDKEREALKICDENIGILESEYGEYIDRALIVESDIKDFNEQVDVVLMNPPFGTKQKHADREFLERSFMIAEVTYSFHKSATNDYIIKFSMKKGYTLKERFEFDFMLRNTMRYHQKKRQYIKVSCFLFEKGE